MGIAVAAVLGVALVWQHVRTPLMLSLLHLDKPDAPIQRNLFACDGKTLRRACCTGPASTRPAATATRRSRARPRTGTWPPSAARGPGDPIATPVRDTRFARKGTRLPPIAQALQSEKEISSVDYLLAHGDGATLRQPAGGGLDGTQAAALSDCMACVEWAVRHHAPVDGTWQATPMALWLDGAGRGTHEAVNLQRLQVLGLSATAVGEDGRSALHAAANNGDLDAVNWLLAQGADPTQADGDGFTPLLYAVNQLGTGPDNRRIDPGAPSDLERVRVVQRLVPVTPTVERLVRHPIRHLLLSPTSPDSRNPIDYAAATAAYPALQEQASASLSDLIDPSASQ